MPTNPYAALAQQKLAESQQLSASLSAPSLAPYQAPQPPAPVDAPTLDGGGAVGNGDRFADIAKRFGLRMTGGDRTPESNAKANGVKNSYHLKKGWAGDFVGSAKAMQEALVWAQAQPGTLEALVHNAGSGQHLHWAATPQGGARRPAAPSAPSTPNGSGRVGQATGLSPAEAWIIQHESGGNPQAWNNTVVYDRGKRLGNAFGIGQIVSDTPRASRDQSVAGQMAQFRNYVKQRYGTAEKAQAFWQQHHWY